MAESTRRLLAIETSGEVGSVALGVVDGDGHLAVPAREFLGERGRHATAAIPAIERVLARAGVDRREVDGVVVGAGPGSFTGVRVAAALGKGFATARDLPLYAVSSLTAAVWTEEAIPEPRRVDPSRVVGVLFDARGGRLFAAAFRPSGIGFETVATPRFTTLDELLEDGEFEGAALAGEGAARNAPRLEAAGRVILPPPVGFPSADGLLRAWAVERPDPVDRAGWEPDYLRASSAERERGG